MDIHNEQRPKTLTRTYAAHGFSLVKVYRHAMGSAGGFVAKAE
jgi:hypothetical protein